MMLTKPFGRIDAPIVIVGDAPNPTEIANGVAFSDGSFDLIEELLYKVGFDVNDCVFVNGFQGKKPYGRPLRASELQENADEFLIPFIDDYERKLIFALGNNALCALGISDKPEKINSLRMCTNFIEGVPHIVSIHPFFIKEEPDKLDECFPDFQYAKRVYDGDISEQVEIQEIRILDPNQIHTLLKESHDYPYIAYDFEATDKEPSNAEVLTLSFANGRQNKFGKYVGLVWENYNQLERVWSDSELKVFKESFTDFFNAAKTTYDLVAWNMGYDDWVAEEWLGTKLPGSTWDGMIMSWVINNTMPNGLKENVESGLGYPNYEKPITDIFNEVKARRAAGKALIDPLDFKSLKMAGVEPLVHVSRGDKETLRWPVDVVDKGYCGYGCIPGDLLCKYNVLDSVYTWLLFDKYADIIEKNNLMDSLELRMRITREFMLAVRRGFLVDVPTAENISKELGKIADASEIKIKEEALKIDPTLEDFKPSSNPALAKLLFGTPIELPRIDTTFVVEENEIPANRIRRVVEEIENFEELFYADEEQIIESVKEGTYDKDHMTKLIMSEFHARFPKYKALTSYQNTYLTGLVQPEAYTKKGFPCVGKAILQSLYEKTNLEILALILMQRKASKLKSTFVDGILKKRNKETNVLHGRLNPIGTNSGRASSSNPNMQNMVSYLRGILIARPGYTFVTFDLSQAEVRAVAARANDPVLLEAIRNADNGDAADIHCAVAAKIFKVDPDKVSKHQRRAAKNIVFGMIYGIGAKRLSLAIGTTPEEAEEMIAEFFDTFPKLKEWIENQVVIAHKKPFYVYTSWGTRRSTRNTKSTNKRIAMHYERVASNMPIQGDAGELTLWLICEMMDYIRKQGWDVHMVNTTHDSVTFEVPIGMEAKVTDMITTFVENGAPIPPLNRVKFKCDIEDGPYWYGKPDTMKAIDPDYATDRATIRFDLIKIEDEDYTKEELDELYEIDELYEQTKQ